MTRKEYLDELVRVPINEEIVHHIETMYSCKLPDIVKQILSYSKESVFFDDGYRALSPAEVFDAQADLHVDFQALGLIPLMDCGENDFIVYHVHDGFWSNYNIVDELVFKKKALLKDLLI